MMITCDKCGTQHPIEDIKFTDDSALCPACQPSESSMINGMPSEMFIDLISFYFERKDKESHHAIMAGFITSKEDCSSYVQNIHNTLSSLIKDEYNSVTLDDLKDMIARVMFFSNYSNDEISDFILSNKKHSDKKDALALAIMFVVG